MKVLIFNGSPRSKGATSTVLHRIEKELKERDVKVDFYDLGSIGMSHCTGCCTCYRTGACCLHDDAEILSQKISEADGIVLGSPTYASNVSGLMKDFIDRGHFVIEQLLYGKPCITVATGENYGNRSARKVLDNLVLYSGGKISDHILLKIPFNGISGMEKHVEKRTRRASVRLIRELQGKKKHLVQCFCHRIIFCLGIRPFVRKKGDAYAGVVRKWKERGII